MTWTLDITGFPAFILLAFTTGDISKASRSQVMLSAKLSQVMHGILDTIRRCNDRVSYLRWCMSKGGKAHLLTSLGIAFRAFVCFTHLALCFFTRLSADHCKSMPLNLFRRGLPTDTGIRSTKLCSSALFTTSLRDNPTQTRASDFQDIKGWLQGIHPMLLTNNQHLRKQYQFQNFEGKGIGAVLIPGNLQFGVFMLLALKIKEMIVTTFTQAQCATNVDFTSGNADNAINARCVGDSRGHANCLSLAPYLFLLPGEQGYSLFSAIDQITDRQHPDYTFFLPALKAEERG